MKVVLTEETTLNEREWRQLQHESILQLFDTEDCPVYELTWFLSPVVELTLDDVLKKPCHCGKYCKPCDLAVPWVKDITSALNYIHKKELGFLNLKLSNVMICKDESVKIFGFHRLNKIGEFTTGYDVPDEFRPPESFSALGGKLPVEGKAFDLWCLGLLSIELFTGKYLARKVSDDAYCWSDRIYPHMFKILQKNKFNRRCRRVFPSCKIKENTLKLIRNFSKGCLRISPKLRPPTGTLLHHKLFEETGLLLKKDKVWKKELKPKDLSQKVEKCKKELKPKDVRQEVKATNFSLDCIQSNSHNVGIQPDNQQIGTGNKDYEVTAASPSESVTSESEEEEVPVEQILQNTPENSLKGNGNISCHFSSPVKTEVSDEIISSCSNLFTLQEMFDRIVIGNCQQNFTCRFLHTESVVNTMRNCVECKRENEHKGKGLENLNAMQSAQSSSRVNSRGYKIASKIFQGFI